LTEIIIEVVLDWPELLTSMDCRVCHGLECTVTTADDIAVEETKWLSTERALGCCRDTWLHWSCICCL